MREIRVALLLRDIICIAEDIDLHDLPEDAGKAQEIEHALKDVLSLISDVFTMIEDAE